MIDQALHEKEGRARVDSIEPFPQRKIGVDEAAAIGGPGGIDQRVDAPEPLQREVEDRVGRMRVFEIRRDECASRAGAFDRRDRRRGLRRVASDDDDRRGALTSGANRDRQANALACAGNEDSSALQSRSLPYERSRARGFQNWSKAGKSQSLEHHTLCAR